MQQPNTLVYLRYSYLQGKYAKTLHGNLTSSSTGYQQTTFKLQNIRMLMLTDSEQDEYFDFGLHTYYLLNTTACTNENTTKQF